LITLRIHFVQQLNRAAVLYVLLCLQFTGQCLI